MIRSLAALIGMAAAGLAFASPAAAGEAEYLELREQLPFLSDAQLLGAAQQVCQATNSGVGSSEIVTLIQEELDPVGVSVASATTITTGAIILYGC